MDLIGPAPRLAVNALGGLAAGVVAQNPYAAIDPARAPAQGPGHAPAHAPGQAPAWAPDQYVPAPVPAGPRHEGLFGLGNGFEENDKWLIPVIVVAVVGVFLSVAAFGLRLVRRLGIPLRD